MLEGYIKIHGHTIQTYLDKIEYSGIFRNYSSIFWPLCHPGIFWILAYSKPEVYSGPWCIQNSGVFRTRDIFRILGYFFRALGYSEPKAYSEPCQSSMMERFKKQLKSIIIFTSYNYFQNISFSCPPVHEINMIFLIQV